MTWWHDDMTLPWSLITILRLLSKVYRLKCLKFETKTHSLTHLVTRVKSRNASPPNKETSLLSLLAPKELYTWYHPALTTQHHPHFEHTHVLSNNFDYWCMMTLLTVISMITKMTISDDTYPRYMIHDQWWWYMMAIHDDIWYMIYDIWYMIYDDIRFMFYNMFMIWYDMFNLDIWWCWC